MAQDAAILAALSFHLAALAGSGGKVRHPSSLGSA